MRIDNRGHEFAHFPAQGALSTTGAADISFDAGVTWHPMIWNAERTSVKIMVAGPNATSVPSPSVTLVAGNNDWTIRFTDGDEVVYRSREDLGNGGYIEVR